MSQPVFSFKERVGLLFIVEGATYVLGTDFTTGNYKLLLNLQSIDMRGRRHPSLCPCP